MKDHGVVAFWNDDLTLLNEEFKEEFNRMTDTANGDRFGLYTFIFSSYHDYKVYTEVFYVQVYEKHVVFLWAPYSLILDLDDELQVLSGDLIPDGNLFLRVMFDEGDDLSYIGPITDYIGNSYEIFSLKYEAPQELTASMYEYDKMDINNIALSDDVLMDAAMKFLEYKIELFAVQVESSIDSNSPDVDIESNPLQNMYFDREIHGKMQREKRFLGAGTDE